MLFELSKINNKIVKKVNLKDLGWKEKDLEEYVTNHIQELISEDLMPIFNERRGQEEPDILALDKDGNLYIFELKRWESTKENLLQVFRYGQNKKFGRASYEQLNELYHTMNDSDEQLAIAHQKYFDLEESQVLDECSFNRKQKFIILTNGVDFETIEAIKFWKSNSIDIESMIYNVYQINDKHYIEFNTYSPYGVVPEDSGISYFVLNTNKKYDETCTKDMIDNKIAAAYEVKKEVINKLHKNDKVYLYEKANGIVGRGVVKSGKVLKKQWWGKNENCYYVELTDFVSFVNSAVKPNFRIVQHTLWRISKENADEMDDNIKKCILTKNYKNCN